MFRTATPLAILALASAVSGIAQVETMGDVSFAVPGGWTYTRGTDVGAMVLKAPPNFWLMAVYSPMAASGDVSADLRTAWKRVVLPDPQYQGFPLTPYVDLLHCVGYRGQRADASSLNRANYTRLYVLEAGPRFIPVIAVSNDGMVLNSQEHIANALLGSVRLSPLKAAPIKTTITLADLAGDWKSGLGNTIAFYNGSTGAIQGTSNSAVGEGYHIEPNGAFTYKMAGMINNRGAGDSDSGVVELGGEFITFRGRSHVVRYRFLNLQQALDGTPVLTLLPPGDMAHISIIRDSQMWLRKK